MDLILASSSPRRKELLKKAHLRFSVAKPNVIEEPKLGEKPISYVKRLAFEKATYVKKRFPKKTILAADTIVVVGEKILEKPRSRLHAKKMLKRLSGRTHFVITGYCLLSKEKRRIQSVKTKVEFVHLTDKMINQYVATGESMDKAGAYAAQGYGMNLIKKISGSYTNVVGLPVAEVLRDLQKL